MNEPVKKNPQLKMSPSEIAIGKILTVLSACSAGLSGLG